MSVKREDFNMAGAADGYKYADQITNQSELLERAIKEGERFVKIYQRDVAHLLVRVAVEMIRAYALGFIDGAENVVPCPAKCVLSIDEKGRMVVRDLPHRLLLGNR